MRAVLSTAVLAVFAEAQSAATTTAYTQAFQACQAPLNVVYSNQACSQQTTVLSQAMSGAVASADVARFCSTGCLSTLANAYTSVGRCLEGYKPTLVAALTADKVQQPELMADYLTLGYRLIPQVFNMMCTYNERGDACMPLYSRMGSSLLGAAGNITNVCNGYFGIGCCLSSLDELYTSARVTSAAPATSFITSLKGLCPAFENFNPPKCLTYGQTAVAINAKIPLKGLLCAAYNAQSDEFKTNFQAALKRDLATAGISASFTTIKSFADVKGVCNLELVVRAGTDTATRDLKTVITAASISLPESIQVASTASPSITNGALSVDPATMSEATITGPKVGNSGSGLSPSLALVACFTLLAKFF